MRIALINASPKAAHSSSRTLIRSTIGLFPVRTDIELIDMHKPAVSEEIQRRLFGCDAWILYFPLYVDGLPSHLLSCLMQLETISKPKTAKLYGVCNCGFYEGEQTDCTFRMLQSFAERAGLEFCGGVGVGAGGLLSMSEGFEDVQRFRRSIIKQLARLAKTAAKGETMEISYATADMPRLFYKLGAELLWRRTVSENGGSVLTLGKKDL